MTETALPFAATPRSVDCRAQAEQAWAAAAAAELPQVREKLERSARVWTELADQEDHRTASREARLRLGQDATDAAA